MIHDIQPSITDKEHRAAQVAQMRANFAIEGMEPRPEDVALQAGYIDGTVTLVDMLDHAREYVKSSRDTSPD
jgi:Antitoxin VbhA